MKKTILGLLFLGTQVAFGAQYINFNAPAGNMNGAGVVAQNGYTPVSGPLQLGDSATGQGILSKALHSGNLQAEAMKIGLFVNTLPPKATAYTYQEIVDAIRTSFGSQQALDALEALEKTIMYVYQSEAYMMSRPYGTYSSSFLPNGIRWSWVNPLEWLSIRSWTSDNNKKLEQLIDEIEQLSNVAKSVSVTQSVRMKTIVQSYRNWRNMVAGAVAAYVAVDAALRGNKSILGTAAGNLATDISGGASAALDLVVQGLQAGWNPTYRGAAIAATGAMNVTCYVASALAQGTYDAANWAYSATGLQSLIG